ncbi:MAG: thiamine pyrophosphate-dependent enzyme, partial [Acidimicrobiales bacterium]
LGEDTVALAFVGDGATSEGDFHEALNLAAVFRAPVVFLVQNNGYAISVPLARQSAAPSLAYKGVGYGIPSEQVDGNDAVAVLAVVGAAVDRARGGDGPSLVEAHTYRVEAHTNADDATRYRDQHEVDSWLRRDPVARLEAWLRRRGDLDDARAAGVAEEAERAAGDLRARIAVPERVDPLALFEHVYHEPTASLQDQRARLAAEMGAAGDGAGAGGDGAGDGGGEPR